MFKKVVVVVMSVALSLSTFTVIDAAKQTGISSKKIVLKVGKTKKLTVKNAKKVKWKSSNKKVAKVNKKGVVKAISKGKAKITAKAGSKVYTCKVVVKGKKDTDANVETNAPVVTPVATTSAAVQSPAASQIPQGSPSVTIAPEESPVATDISEATATPVSTPTETPIFIPTEEPENTADPDLVNPKTQVVWPDGMKSGLLDDFNTYFNVDVAGYINDENAGSSELQKFTYHSDVIGTDREAYIYLPPNYDENGSYPVVYMLHGLGARASQWGSMSVGAMFNTMINKGEIKPFIAVMPDIIPKDGLSGSSYSKKNINAFTVFQVEFTEDLEPYILENYAVSDKPEDTGVCGLSMGGMEALSLGFHLKNHFNYIGSFSAAPTLSTTCLNIKNWEFAPKVVMVCTGDSDDTVGENPYNYHMALLKNKVEHIWYYYPGGKHSGDVWQNAAVNFAQCCFGNKGNSQS